jgi:hypothetical protein
MKMEILRRFWRDDIPLPTLRSHVIRGVIIILGVWIAWYPATAVFFIVDLLLTGARGGAVPVHAIHVIYRYGLWILTLGFIATLPIAFWRATATALAKKRGPLITKLGASACALAVVLVFAATGEFVVVMSWLYGFADPYDSHDQSRTSSNASTSVSREPSFPLTGFWQPSCDKEDVGIAIERESRWLKLYRFEFCGPLGCQFRSESTIVGDPEYRVIDFNTIEFEASTAIRYTTIYHRCG